MTSITGITYVSTKPIFNLCGLSTDQEPLNPEGCEGNRLTNGSTLLVMDTGDVKKFDEENNKWLLL